MTRVVQLEPVHMYDMYCIVHTYITKPKRVKDTAQICTIQYMHTLVTVSKLQQGTYYKEFSSTQRGPDTRKPHILASSLSLHTILSQFHGLELVANRNASRSGGSFPRCVRSNSFGLALDSFVSVLYVLPYIRIAVRARVSTVPRTPRDMYICMYICMYTHNLYIHTCSALVPKKRKEKKRKEKKRKENKEWQKNQKLKPLLLRLQ